MSRPDKPGSVVDNHSSRTYVTVRLKQPTRPQRGPRQRGPIWSCSGWSLPCHELLPVARCALTAPFHPYLIPLAWAIGGLLSVALVVGSRPPGVTWHPALWSPDFPPPAYAGSDCLGQLTARIIPFFLEAATLLAALFRPNHIVYLCSWGLKLLPPRCNSDEFG